MNYEIKVGALDIWDFYIDNVDEFKTHEVLIAENKKNGKKVYLTHYSGGTGKLIVEQDGKEIDCDFISSDRTAQAAYSYILAEHIKSDDIDDYAIPDEEIAKESEAHDEECETYTEEERVELEAEASARHDELVNELKYFLLTALDHDDSIDPEEEAENLLEPVLKAIADNGCAVYAPTFYVDTTGTEYYEEYPY